MRRDHRLLFARARRLAVGIALTGALATAATPAPAAMDWSKASIRVWHGSCASTDEGLYYNPKGQVLLREFGASGVIRFEAKYRLYRTNVTAGWNFPRLERTYASGYFSNDAKNRFTFLPNGAFHEWTQVFATNTYRLDVKAEWDRGIRRDWTSQRTIAFCR